MASAVNAYNIRRFLSKSKVDISQSVGGIHFPGININPAITAAKEVGKGNIIRITVTTAGRIAFGSSTIIAPTGAVDTVSVYLQTGTHYVYATDDFVRGDGTIVASSIEVLTA